MITPAIIKAAEVVNSSDRIAAYVSGNLAAVFNAVDKSENPQAVLDALGARAGIELQCYVIFLTALRQADALRASLGIAPVSEELIEPDQEVYQLSQDGTVTYISPTQ